MKKAYISPRTRHIDLSTESPLLDISMPVVRDDEGAGYEEVLTRRSSIWDNWSDEM